MLSRWVRWILSITIVCWVGLGVLSPPAFAQTINAIGDEVPMGQTADGLEADWNRISFSSLPQFESAGEITVPDTVLGGNLDYTLSRSWQAGASPADVLKVGDIDEAFGLNTLTLGQTVPFTNVAPDHLSLSNLPFLSSKTLADLVGEVPGLGNVAIKQVKPLFDLVKAAVLNTPIGNIGQNNPIWSEQPLSVLSQMPEIGNLQLGSLDLSQYSFAQIPGLDQLAIENIAGANNLTLSAIPGLPNIPLANLPLTPGKAMGYIAIHNVTYGGDYEHDESRQTPTKFSITGSDRVGFNYNCHQEQGCDYLELESPVSLGSAGDPTKLHGARWIRGGKGKGEQMVKGGSGILGALNSGMEPTGRHPFGKAFKVVLTDTDESTGTGKFSLYFRVCQRRPINLGCTPYFIGPIPWFPTHEKGIVIVGLTEQAPPSGIQAPEIPADVQDVIDQYGGSEETSGGSSLCGAGYAGVDFQALAEGISGIEGGYGSVSRGADGCSFDGRYGRGLGRYQYMSYRSDTRAVIQKYGGGAMLAQLDVCSEPTSAEVQRFFPPAEQDKLFRTDQLINIKQAQREIDPSTGKPFTGARLIERVGQIHFGGTAARIDGGYSDGYGRLSVYQYGRELLKNYQTAAKQKGGICQESPNSGKGNGKSTGALQNPAPGTPITSEFGARDKPCAACSSFHQGLDFGVPSGTSIKAADGGVVVFSGWMSGYGETVIVDHKNGLMTLYAHNSQRLVKVGDPVSQGQTITRSGASGVGTGPHLHFGVIEGATPGDYRSGRYADPRRYLKI